MANESTKVDETGSLRPRSSRRGLWIGVAVLVVVVMILAAGFATSWFGLTSSGTNTQTITLSGQGSTFALPVISAWSTQYQTLTGVQINYQGTGSGAGINNIIAKNDDFGATDAPLNATQHQQNPSLLTIPESLGAVTIAYNVPGIPSHVNLTGPIIANIYLRLITNWNDASISSINPGVTFPNLAIIPVHRSDASGPVAAHGSGRVGGADPGSGVAVGAVQPDTRLDAADSVDEEDRLGPPQRQRIDGLPVGRHGLDVYGDLAARRVELAELVGHAVGGIPRVDAELHGRRLLMRRPSRPSPCGFPCGSRSGPARARRARERG